MHDAAGVPLLRDQPPEQLSVELGGDFLPWGEVKVRAVLAPECGYLAGDGGIAVVGSSGGGEGLTAHAARNAREASANARAANLTLPRRSRSAASSDRASRYRGGRSTYREFGPRR